MKRLYKILFVLSLIGFILLIAYAFVEPVRAWMQTTIGPPVSGALGGFATIITSSYIWKTHIVPFPNQLIIGAVVIGMPLMWLATRAYTRTVRPMFVRGAMRDSGMYPMDTKPVTKTPTVQQPVPTHPTPTPQPSPPPPQQQTVEPVVEEKSEA